MKKRMIGMIAGALCLSVQATTTTVDFESYTAGIAPPSPWTADPGVIVTDSIARAGSKSLAVSWDYYDRARYPLAVEPGESASFSVWVRPSPTEANAKAASVGVVPSNTSRVRHLEFERSFFSNDGSTYHSVHWNQYGGTLSVQGDYTSGNWYLVNGEITPTEIILSTTTESGLLSYSFDRMGEAITAIELGFGGGNEDEPRVAYYDDLTIIPPQDDVTLTVASVHGTPAPAIGTTTNSWGSTATCSVAHVDAGTTQYECIGWAGTGSVPASGTSNAVEVILTEDSSITWNWATNYLLDITISGDGSVDADDAFYAKDSEQILTATPDSGWLFMGWSGDASGTNDAILTMDGPQAVTATFSDDADGDGLTNTEEDTAGSNPWKTDTDDDGFDDKLEVDNGGSPTVSDQWRIDYISANGEVFGLYSSNAVLDVAVGQMLIDIFDGTATMNLQLEESEDLITWTNAGPPEVWNWPVDGAKKFFRVRSSE
jgi:hypothetical protein